MMVILTILVHGAGMYMISATAAWNQIFMLIVYWFIGFIFNIHL